MSKTRVNGVEVEVTVMPVVKSHRKKTPKKGKRATAKKSGKRGRPSTGRKAPFTGKSHTVNRLFKTKEQAKNTPSYKGYKKHVRSNKNGYRVYYVKG